MRRSEWHNMEAVALGIMAMFLLLLYVSSLFRGA